MANKTSALSAKQRSARLKFLKGYESVTVNRGRDDYLFLDECLKHIFPATSTPKLKMTLFVVGGGGRSGSCVR